MPRFPHPEATLDKSHCEQNHAAIMDALYVLHGKWRLAIIIAINSGNYRFGDIRKAVGSIAPKVLSSELKLLELNGFITRTVHDTMPVVIEYRPTDYSNSLYEVVEALRNWGLQHRAKIRAEANLVAAIT